MPPKRTADATPTAPVVAPVTAVRSGRARPASDPGNQTPDTKRVKDPAVTRFWRWLMEDTKEEKAGRERKRPTRHAADTKRTRKAVPARQGVVSRLIGEEHKTDAEGEPVLIGPPQTDWRWNLHLFLRSKRRVFVYSRSVLLVSVLVLSAWTALFLTTGFNLADAVFAPADEEDVSTLLRTPFFVVESGSLMQLNQPFGRLRTIDPGDIVIVERIEDRNDVQTFYGTGDRFVANGRGDVIVFLPVPTQANPNPSPIVHRAVAYLERTIVQVPNPDPSPDRPPMITAPRFTVAEFGVYDARSVTIPELGLYNYQPDRSGFITRGDNPRTNNWADQALGVTVHPVPEDRILGRVKYTVPYLGLAKIALVGQDPMTISPDNAWCSFLAGKAPCDSWVMFLIITALFVGVPFFITFGIFVRRAVKRRGERLQLAREQDAALQRRLEEEARHGAPASADDEARPLELHDAVDLLSGRVVPAGADALAPRVARRPLRLPRGAVSTDGVS
jgi:signal peptidase I